MNKKTKYVIVSGIIGLFVGYGVFGIAGLLAWLFIVGDGPTSSAQDLFAIFFVFGAVIVSWLITVYVGYRLGVRAENDVNNLRN